MTKHIITGGGGLKLAVHEFGDPSGLEILFIHGWSQHHLCWTKQIERLSGEFRLLCMDLRGHGASEAPVGKEYYTDGALWAGDVAATIKAVCKSAPVLVGWSYGGFVIGDYLRCHGDASISGVVLAGGAVVIGPTWFGTHIGPGFLDHAPGAMSEDQVTALKSIVAFAKGCFAKPIANADMDLIIAFNAIVRPDVRASLGARGEDFRADYGACGKPILVAHGKAETVVLPKMAEEVLAANPRAVASWYEGVNHGPFIEEPERFNRELAAFTRSANAGGNDVMPTTVRR
jgi:pimeloyl-ACP methyl ester carboxylesterase